MKLRLIDGKVGYVRQRICRRCGQEFEAVKIGHQGRYPGYCSDDCRRRRRNLTGRPRGRPPKHQNG